MQNLTTQQELFDALAAIKGEAQAQILSKTVVKMNKKDVATKTIANTFGTIYKIQTIDVELNTDYEAEVNVRRMVEGAPQDFSAGALPWGNSVNNIVIENNGQMYIKTVELGKVGEVIYCDDSGNIVHYESIKPFIPVYNGAAKQELNDEVKVRTFKLSSIARLVVTDKFKYLSV